MTNHDARKATRGWRFDLVSWALAGMPAVTLVTLMALAPAITGAAKAPSEAPVKAADPAETVESAGADGIWLLDGNWKDDSGATIQLAKFAGKPAFVTMFYTSCPDICPALLDQMKRVDEAARKAGIDATIVLVSLDPKHDDSKRLASFRAHLGSDARWHLLAGDEGSTRALANLLGVRFGTDPKTGEISHDGKITFVDQSGATRASFEGTKDDIPAFIGRVLEAQAVSGRKS